MGGCERNSFSPAAGKKWVFFGGFHSFLPENRGFVQERILDGLGPASVVDPMIGSDRSIDKPAATDHEEVATTTRGVRPDGKDEASVLVLRRYSAGSYGLLTVITIGALALNPGVHQAHVGER
ncbi:hypothetical protein ACLOJK_002444 [Asimina triloba]